MTSQHRNLLQAEMIMSHNMMKIQLSQHFCRETKVFRCAILVHVAWKRHYDRLGVQGESDFYTFRSFNTCIANLTTCLFAVL